MPTRNVSLTKQQDQYITQVVKSGEYQNASEAMRDAVRALQDRRRMDKLKLQELRAAVQAGVDSLERGDYIDVAPGQLGAYLDSLTSPPRKRTR